MTASVGGAAAATGTAGILRTDRLRPHARSPALDGDGSASRPAMVGPGRARWLRGGGHRTSPNAGSRQTCVPPTAIVPRMIGGPGTGGKRGSRLALADPRRTGRRRWTTDACRSRSSRPSSSATSGSATTSPRASVSDAPLAGRRRARARGPGPAVRRSRRTARTPGGHRRGRPGRWADDVLVTPGAAAALFIVHTTLLEAGEHVIVARPNYATNLETPRALGRRVDHLDLRFEDGWAVDPERIAALIDPEDGLVVSRPPTTRPARSSGDGPREVVRLVEATARPACSIDETYRDMTYGGPLPLAAPLDARDRRVVAVQDRRAAGHPDRLADHDRTTDLQGGSWRRRSRSSSRTRSSTRRSPRSRWRAGRRLPRIRAGIAAALDGPGLARRTRTSSSGSSRAAESSASRASGRRSRSTSIRSTGSCSRPRHARRPRPLVRSAAPAVPARLRLADSGRARAGAGRAHGARRSGLGRAARSVGPTARRRDRQRSARDGSPDLPGRARG